MTTQSRNTAQSLHDAGEAIRNGDLAAAGDAVEDAWTAFQRFEAWVNSILPLAEKGAAARAVEEAIR